MGRRLDLHEELKALLGSSNVYFQPPETIKLKYPCIIYHLSTVDSQYADNHAFTYNHRYTIQAIAKDPDWTFPDKLGKSMKMIRFDRFFTANNLNHWNFELYY